MKKVMITGANGFVGSHLIEYILNEHPDYEVYGMRRAFTSSMNNVRHIKDERLTWIDCDLTDQHNVESLFRKVKFDKIFHLAAQSFVPKSFDAPNRTMEDNIIGTVNLLESIKKYNKDAVIMVCSSSEVYGHQIHTPTKETEPFAPLSPYAMSKCGEDILGTLYNKIYGVKAVISRAFTHTGERQSEVFFIPAFSKQIALIEKGLQEPVIKVGNLDSHRTIMNVRDCVKAYWLLTENGVYGEAYNIGGIETWPVEEVLKYLISLSTVEDIQVKISDDLIRPKDVNMQIPDCTKFKEITDWKPEYPVKDTINEVLNFWRKNI